MMMILLMSNDDVKREEESNWLCAWGPWGPLGDLGIWNIRLVGGTLSFKAYIAKFGLFWAWEMGIGLS